VRTDALDVFELEDLGVEWQTARMETALAWIERGHRGETQTVELPASGEVPGVTDVAQGVRRR